jgi:glyoxylase-like metal-dependent hydrolase (beta-lactamase superfamily II)
LAKRPWFKVHRHGKGIIRIDEHGHRHRINSYLVEGARDVAIIDAGMGFANFKELADSLSDRDPIVLLTHAHWDHVGDAWLYDRVFVHESETDDLRTGTTNQQLQHWFQQRHLFNVDYPPETDPDSRCIPGTEPSGYLNEGDVIDLGERELEVIHTPGHSVGSVSFMDWNNRAIFTGDAVYGGTLLINFEGTDPEAYRETFRKLAALSPDIDEVYGAHMDAPMDAKLLPLIHETYEQIVAGQLPPHRRIEQADVYKFDGFGFWMRPGSYERARACRSA